MKISTSRFGDIDLPDTSILKFPEGLPGFEGKSYALIQRPETPVVAWLQSILSAEVAVMTVLPSDIGLTYDPRHKTAETMLIRPNDESDDSLEHRVIVSTDDAGRVRLNLFAPVFINHQAQLAMQIPLVGSGYGVREPWPST